MEPVTVSIKAACAAIGIGNSKLYMLIKDGDLKTVKVGSRTLVTTASIRALVGAE
jgi:excisionase family DNA binding protein